MPRRYLQFVLYLTGQQLVIMLVTALRVVVAVVAATAVRRVTWPRSVLSLGTWPTSSAVTAMRWVMPPVTAISPVTVSLWMCDLFKRVMTDFHTVSRVVCSNCQEKGHFKSRCQNPMKQEEGDNGNGDGGNGDGDGFDNAAGFENSGGGFDGANDFVSSGDFETSQNPGANSAW